MPAPAPRILLLAEDNAPLRRLLARTLRNDGYTVFEAADTWGGKMAEHVEAGYRFDRGPSLFTLPELLDELVDRLARYRDRLTRLCISMVTHGHAYRDTLEISRRIQRRWERDIPARIAVADRNWPGVLG